MYQRPLGSESLSTEPEAALCSPRTADNRRADCATARGRQHWLSAASRGRTPQDQEETACVIHLSSKRGLQVPMEKTDACWPLAILGQPRGHTNPKGPQVSKLIPVHQRTPSACLSWLNGQPVRQRVNQMPLPGSQVLVPSEDTPPHLPTPSLSRFLASQIGNRHRSTRKQHLHSSHAHPYTSQATEGMWPATVACLAM